MKIAQKAGNALAVFVSYKLVFRAIPTARFNAQTCNMTSTIAAPAATLAKAQRFVYEGLANPFALKDLSAAAISVWT